MNELEREDVENARPVGMAFLSGEE